MSAGGAFGGARGYQPKPPDKGVFPLDHFGECKQIKEEYMQCLQHNGSQAEQCRALAKSYLECRMERNLMVKQDLSELGFKAVKEKDDRSGTGADGKQVPQSAARGPAAPADKKKQGFIAGIR